MEVMDMPLINIQFIEGRTVEQKSEIAKAITEVMVKTGRAKPENVIIIFNNYKKSDFAKGGKLYSE